jgi:predicted transcriptional regulator
MKKVTFTLDDETVAQLKKLAARRGWPQSRVVREAVTEYGKQPERLTEEQRDRLLAIVADIKKLPKRPRQEIDAELKEIRRARRNPGRLHPVD